MCCGPFIRYVTFSGYLNKIFKKHEVDFLIQLTMAIININCHIKTKGKQLGPIYKMILMFFKITEQNSRRLKT